MVSAEVAALGFASVVAVTWGASPVVEKFGLSNGGNPIQASVVFVGIAALLYWVSLFAVHGGGVLRGITPFAVAVFGVAGFVGTSFGRILIFEGVTRVGPTVSSAGVSTRPVFSALVAWAWLGESPVPEQAVGIAVLVAGLVVVSISDGGDLTGWTTKELLFPIGAAFLFGAGFVIRRFGLINTSITPLQAVAVNETVALVSLLAFASLKDGSPMEAPASSYRYFVVAGTVTAVGLLSFFAALSIPEGEVAVVDPVAATAPIFTVGFSYLLARQKERITRKLLTGLLLTVAGIGLVVYFG